MSFPLPKALSAVIECYEPVRINTFVDIVDKMLLKKFSMCVYTYLHRRCADYFTCQMAPKSFARLTKVGVPEACGSSSRVANAGPHSISVRMAPGPCPAIHRFAIYVGSQEE